MHLPATARHKAPYGIAFPLAELVNARSWADRRNVRLNIILDHVLEDAVFEEVMRLRGPARARRTVTLWRTSQYIICQHEGGQPKAFASICAALDHADSHLFLVPARKFLWRSILFWT